MVGGGDSEMMLVQMPPQAKRSGKRSGDGKKERKRKGKLAPLPGEGLNDSQLGTPSDLDLNERLSGSPVDESTLPSVRNCGTLANSLRGRNGSGRRRNKANSGGAPVTKTDSFGTPTCGGDAQVNGGSCKGEMFSCMTPPPSSFSLPPLKKTITGGD
eukprot:TRINITY_DN1832_c1_g8_i1.p3 TRINITY_DN1832_c1_g8~~TRINITY_DN1832_c1_g8_i1.p3  ORF type:complete len:157 (+),score=46.23 TRINITY_DN1832_c1_g8_i1:126-596(+)